LLILGSVIDFYEFLVVFEVVEECIFRRGDLDVCDFTF